MPVVEISGQPLFYSDGGVPWRAGLPLVVLLHGAGADSTVWALQSRSLARHGYNVAALDLPGHGRSAERPDSMTIDSLAGLVVDFCAAVDSSVDIALIGHSMGACIALTIAADASRLEPRRVHKLVLMGAGMAMPVNPSLLEATLSQPLEAHRFIAAFGHGAPAQLGGSEMPGVWTLGAAFRLLDRTPNAVLHRDFVACDAWRGEGLVGRVSCDTLVISGALDRMTPPSAGEALSVGIARSRFEVLPGVGHMIPAEAPTALRGLLLEFL